MQADHHLFAIVQTVNLLRLLFRLSERGNSIAARMAIMAITTNNSIKVKPRRGATPHYPWVGRRRTWLGYRLSC
jgi:hypothetical protein